MRKSTPVRILLAFLLFVGLLALPAQADDEHSKDLTGTWDMTAEINGHTGHAMVTFISDGTFIHTGASKNNVNAHGVWKKIDSLTFVEQNREYVFVDEELALFADTSEVIELSEDGNSFVGHAVAELKTIDDGTVVQVVEFTIYGTRRILNF